MVHTPTEASRLHLLLGAGAYDKLMKDDLILPDQKVHQKAQEGKENKEAERSGRRRRR